ncbi:transcriptional regulator [Aquincola sp. S2]|uniref:Transcriptional regulator n=1 Tax=Pseudaquabacterium terrae TaxID=2732868 RepID=A0ABX2EPD1_9BURK|nr:LuxR C-terminal-related transcriptional regulator [Aquabacterium terrae]NRF70560.1 transcriptional regulator [Aquabacterium terrae]
MNFARTKIQPPRQRASLIARPALEQALGEALAEQRLTLISAPAGFGKTVALTRQIQGVAAGTALAWVSLDEGDDLPRLLECLFTALEPYDLPWRVDSHALAMSAGGNRSERSAVAHELINTLAATEVPRGVIVLDDLHRCTDTALFEFLDLFVARLPPAWGLVIASRVDPPLALPRLRVAGELAEFRQAELSFDHREVLQLGAALDGHAGQALTDADADLLLARTGGWAAGLRLALTTALAQRGDAAGIDWAGAGRPMDRRLFDYLADEVLRDMPDEMRDFLLRCSVLPELSAARCAAVSGDALAAHRLADIERRELFVTVLEGPERTLRLHDIFRDFLAQRLKLELGAELPALYRRAAAGETDPVRRVGLLLLAPAYDEAAAALVEVGPALLQAGAGAQVVRLIEQIPQAHSPPQLLHLRGLCAGTHWEWATMQTSMARAALGFERAGVPQLARRSRAYEVVALSGCGQLDAAAQRLAELRAVAPDGDDPTQAFVMLVSTWDAVMRGPAANAAAHLGAMVDVLERCIDPTPWFACMPHMQFVGLPGMRRALERYVMHALDRAGEREGALRAGALMLQAWLLLWRGDADAARSVVREVQQGEAWFARPRNLRLPLQLLLATDHALRGEAAPARALWQDLLDDVENDEQRRSGWGGVYLFLALRLAWLVDDQASIASLMPRLEASAHAREWPFMRAARQLLRGQLALQTGRAGDAVPLLAAALAESSTLDTLGLDAGVRALAALAHLRCGDRTAAWRALSPLLQQAGQSGEVAGLMMSGEAVLAELARATWADDAAAVLLAPLHEALRRLQALRAGTMATPTDGEGREAAARGPSRLQQDLSPREAEVLERIAAGESNKLIARAFDLSPHTVKRHVANILDKIGASSRGEAAAWWHQRQ